MISGIIICMNLFKGGLMLSVQDSATAEEVEQVTQPDVGLGSDTASNLLSSGIMKKIEIIPMNFILTLLN